MLRKGCFMGEEWMEMKKGGKKKEENIAPRKSSFFVKGEKAKDEKGNVKR